MVIFEKLRWKNFLSYGNTFTEIELNSHKMSVIMGKNAAGKTTFGEALTFALFGVPFRNINKPNLVNSINQKDCLVEVEFSIGTKKYLVRRGIKPVVFEIFCDGVLIDQSSKSKDYQKYLEQNILKLNYKTFTQLVFLGSSNFRPFMQLPALERREVIEDLLDIRIFSKMNVVLKEKISEVKSRMKELEKDLVVVKEKIDLQRQHIKKLKEKNLSLIDSNNKDIEKNNAAILQINMELDSLRSTLDALRGDVADLKDVDRRKGEYTGIREKLREKQVHVKKTVAFYEKNNDCPTCNQHIDESFKETTIASANEKLQTLMKGQQEAENQVSLLEARTKEISSILDKISAIEQETRMKSTSISGIQQYIAKLQLENSRLLLDNTESLEEDEKQLGCFQKNLDSSIEEKETLLELQSNYDLSSILLKDSGIKTKIIKQYLPLMNKYVNEYLDSMGFYVNFNLDENFKEVIKSRYRDDFEYNSFSEGQKFRIDMALLLTWREISRKKNSTNTNILILDEVFDSSLDANGMEEFMKLLQVLSQQTHIFVITSKPDAIIDKFDRHLTVRLKNNFSAITT